MQDVWFQTLVLLLGVFAQSAAILGFGYALKRLGPNVRARAFAFAAAMPVMIGAVFLQIQMFQAKFGDLRPLLESRALLASFVGESVAAVGFCIVGVSILLRKAPGTSTNGGTQK